MPHRFTVQAGRGPAPFPGTLKACFSGAGQPLPCRKRSEAHPPGVLVTHDWIWRRSII